MSKGGDLLSSRSPSTADTNSDNCTQVHNSTDPNSSSVVINKNHSESASVVNSDDTNLETENCSSKVSSDNSEDKPSTDTNIVIEPIELVSKHQNKHEQQTDDESDESVNVQTVSEPTTLTAKQSLTAKAEVGEQDIILLDSAVTDVNAWTLKVGLSLKWFIL